MLGRNGMGASGTPPKALNLVKESQTALRLARGPELNAILTDLRMF